MLEFWAIAVLIPLATLLWSAQIESAIKHYREFKKPKTTVNITVSDTSPAPVIRIVLTPSEGRLEVLTTGENRENDVEAMIYAQSQLKAFLAKPYDKAVVDALHVFTEAMGGKVKLVVANPE